MKITAQQTTIYYVAGHPHPFGSREEADRFVLEKRIKDLLSMNFMGTFNHSQEQSIAEFVYDHAEEIRGILAEAFAPWEETPKDGD